MMKKIGLMMMLLLGVACLYADNAQQGAGTLKKKSKAQIETEQRKKDSIQRIIQYNSFMSFVEDSLQYKVKDTAKYKTRDEEIQSNLDSIYNKHLQPLNTAMQKVESGAYSNTMLWVRIMLFSLVFLLIVDVLYLVLRLRGLRDEIIEIVIGSDRIKKWIKNSVEKPSINPVPKSYDSDIRNLQNENRGLKSRVAVLEDALKEKTATSAIETNSYVNQHPSSKTKPVESQKLLYSDSIINGEFSHVRELENDDTIFVLKLKSETQASISLYEGAYNKVLANASYLKGCEMQSLGKNSVEIMHEGEAEMGGNGKWKVVTPLKVEIR